VAAFGPGWTKLRNEEQFNSCYLHIYLVLAYFTRLSVGEVIYLNDIGCFGQQIRNTWKVLKCGAGEEWRRSVGPIM